MRRTSKLGFSLVELLIVISIMMVIFGLITLSASSNKTVEAFVEANRIEQSLMSLRSAWLSCFNDTYYQHIRFPATGSGTYSRDAMSVKMLENYTDRSLADDMDRYGDLMVRCDDAGRLWIGWTKNDWPHIDNDDTKSKVRSHLAQKRIDLYDNDLRSYTKNSGYTVLVKIR